MMMMQHHKHSRRPRSAIALLSIGIVAASLCVLKVLVQFNGVNNQNSSTTTNNSYYSSSVPRYLLSNSNNSDNALSPQNIIAFHETSNYYGIEGEEDYSDYTALAKRAALKTPRLRADYEAEMRSDSDITKRPGLQPLQQYTLQDSLYESSIWGNTFAILIYDPPTDTFITLYNKDHIWNNSKSRILKPLHNIIYMLRQSFPERFMGSESEELVIPIGSGDFPHVIPRCVSVYYF